jgi:hypothetical protein
MRLLSIQTGRQIASSTEDQSVKISYDKPEQVKEQQKGVIITKERGGIIAFQKGERRDEAGKASGLKDGMHGRCITTIDRPAAITQNATGSHDANTWPFAPGKIVMV